MGTPTYYADDTTLLFNIENREEALLRVEMPMKIYGLDDHPKLPNATI